MIITPAEKLKLVAEIHTKAVENCIPIVIFENQNDMKIFIEDMRLGALVRAGLLTLNAPMPKEWM